jgi:hypothetical protein
MPTRTKFIATAATALLLAACNNQGGQNEADAAGAPENGGEAMVTEEGLIPGENTMGNVAGAAGNAAEDVGNVVENAADAVGNTVEDATDGGNSQ